MKFETAFLSATKEFSDVNRQVPAPYMRAAFRRRRARASP